MYQQSTGQSNPFGRRRVSLAEAQVRSRAKATAERDRYSISWQVWTYRLHGETVKRQALVATVTKKDGSGSYTVVYRPQGAPHCSCPSANEHRGTSFRCKHVLLCDEQKPGSEGTDEKEQLLKRLKTELDREWLWPREDGSKSEITRLRNEITRLEQELGHRSN